MARLTITLSDRSHRELKVRAASTGDSIGDLLESALADQKALARLEIRQFMTKAHASAAKAPKLSEEELMNMAVEVTHEVRAEMLAERAAFTRP